jgi:superfamily II DNA or RNA helicase
MIQLRDWQRAAMESWDAAGRHGIVSAVTGSGKTVLALACAERAPEDTTLIVVPTVPLLEQWWTESADFFALALDDIHIVSGAHKMRRGTINISVINTAAKLASRGLDQPCFLIVDECHKAAAPEFRSIFDIRYGSSLGLSATPERQYDDGLQQILVPALGPIIYNYDYVEAHRDKVIVPFHLKNVVFELDESTGSQYQKLTRSIATQIKKFGPDSDEAVSLYLRRARVLNLAPARIEIALRIIARHRGRKCIVFHEDIDSCNVIHEVLQGSGARSGVYHSGLNTKMRVDMLEAFRAGAIDILVTCRALDEGFNVPEAEIGIIAASTATRRQRIQRLGRVLRPAANKNHATIYSLVATGPELARLQAEEAEFEGIAEVTWSRA